MDIQKIQGMMAGICAGWILLLPPMYPMGDKVVVNPDAAAKEWVRLRVFDTQEDCVAGRQLFIDKAQPPPGTGPDFAAAVNLQKMLAKCVDENDPALNGT